MLRVLLLSLLAAGSAANLIINLSDDDASYALNGNVAKSHSTVVINVPKDGATQARVYVLTAFHDQPSTNFYLSDSTTAIFRSQNFTAFNVFSGTLTLSFANNTNFDFSLVFRRFVSAESAAIQSTSYAVIQLHDGENRTTALSANSTAASVYTVLTARATPNPAIFVSLFDVSNASCVISQYVGGQPSAQGESKYKVFDYDFNPSNASRTGLTRSFAATFIVQPGCTATLYTSVSGEPVNTTILYAISPGDSGYWMSYGYRQMDNLQTQYPIANALGYYDKYTLQNNSLSLTVVEFSPGSVMPGALTIIGFTQSYQLTQPTNNYTLSGVTDIIILSYNGTSGDAGFLARFSATAGNSKTATTMTPTTVTKSAASALVLLCSLLAVLRCL